MVVHLTSPQRACSGDEHYQSGRCRVRAWARTFQSQYRGISCHRTCKQWWARIWKNNNSHIIGHLEDTKEAARAFDREAQALCRLKLNFPEEGMSDENEHLPVRRSMDLLRLQQDAKKEENRDEEPTCKDTFEKDMTQTPCLN